MMNIALPKCFYCGNLSISNRLLCPIDYNPPHPHLTGTCHNCLFENAYNEKEKEQPIWVDLITMEIWVDGSCNIPKEGCSNFKESDLIFRRKFSV